MAQILIIEDDVECRSALKYLLERNNYSVETAENGTLGVRMYRENPADLVIVDMIMPAKGGPQTILDIKKDYQRVKFIAMSGGGLGTAEEYLEVARVLNARYTFT